MRKILLSCFAVMALVKMQYAQAPVWSTDIAPILYKNCTSCHHPGGLAPFSLLTYQDAFDHAYSMVNAISQGAMPPWPPDATYRHFADERQMSAADVTKINAWASNGATQGNAGDAPAAPVYTNGSALPQVTKTLQIPTFTVPNINNDLYQCFVVPTDLTQNEYITAFEILPGDPSIVHHVLIYEDTSASHVARGLDNQSVEPGYTNFGGPGVDKAILVGGWVPGTRPGIYPNGMGVLLHKGSDLIMQIHYPNGSSGKTDSTKLNLRLSTGNLRAVSIAPPLNHALSITEPLIIPANTTKTFTEEFTVPNYNFPGYDGISLLNIAPHAHLICKNWLVYAITPTQDTIPLIKINDWDFHWQGFYTFQKLQFIPKGTKMYAHATYDNTANNPHNPNSPPKQVTVGEATTDEMMLVYVAYLVYQPGDENMVLDSSILQQPTDIGLPIINDGTISTAQLYDAVPNPANGQTTLSYYLPSSGNVQLRLYDINGKLVDEIKATNSVGLNQIQYSTAKLGAGNYLYSLSVGGVVKSKQLVVTK